MTDARITGSRLNEARTREARSLWCDVWRQFWAHKGGAASVVIFLAIILLIIIGPYIHYLDPQFLDIRTKNRGPSLQHPMSTDNLGRDMLAQVLAGGRISLAVGVTAIFLSLFLGTLISVLAGFIKWLDGRPAHAANGFVSGASLVAASVGHHHAVQGHA